MPAFRPPSPPLTDEVVVLTPMEEDDAPDFVRGTNEPDIARFAYARRFDEAAARDYLRQLAGPRRERGESILFAIHDRGGAFLGALQFFAVDWDRRAGDFGFWLLPEARGRGAAGRAIELAVRWITDLGIERVAGQTDVANVAAQRVMERAGFRREGILRGFNPGPSGRVDYVAYARLAGD